MLLLKHGKRLDEVIARLIVFRVGYHTLLEGFYGFAVVLLRVERVAHVVIYLSQFLLIGLRVFTLFWLNELGRTLPFIERLCVFLLAEQRIAKIEMCLKRVGIFLQPFTIFHLSFGVFLLVIFFVAFPYARKLLLRHHGQRKRQSKKAENDFSHVIYLQKD